MRNKFFLIAITIFFLLTLLLSSAIGQTYNNGYNDQSKSKKMFGPPVFLYDTYIFMSHDDSCHCRLDIHVAFSNDILQFIKEKQGQFTAGYDLFVHIFDKKGNQVQEKSIRKEIEAKTFEATNSRQLTNYHQISFDLIADKYKLVIDLTDYDTQKCLHREKEIKIESLGLNKASISDVIFADKITLDSLKNIKKITPNLNRNFLSPNSKYWAYFEIYPENKLDSLTLSYSIIEGTNKTVVRDNQKILPKKKIYPYLLDLSKFIKNPGRFSLLIKTEQIGKISKKRIKFSTNWSNFEISQLNISTAIEVLKDYIPSKDYKFLKQSTDSVKNVWFKNFWKQRDPTPETGKNELLKEFYKRIDIANNYFTVNAKDKEGWKTDRGGIYIKYGPPSDVERQAEELNIPPYEIWFYDTIQRRFVFSDKSGFGDFQLVRIE